MKKDNSLYLGIKKRINDDFEDGCKFTSRDFKDIARLTKRPFNDITVRLNYLAKQKIIGRCGDMPTGYGGHNIVKYRLIDRQALLLLIPDEREQALGAAGKRKVDNKINALILDGILYKITRNRIIKEENEQRAK